MSLLLANSIYNVVTVTLIWVKGARTVMQRSQATAMVVYTEPVSVMWIRGSRKGSSRGNVVT